MKKTLLFLSFLLISTFSYALISDTGMDPLDQTSGAKPLGIGGAFAGASGDINCLFYNPAGLANSRGIIVSGKDIKNLSLGVAYDTDIGNFGVGAVFKNYEISLTDTLEAKYEHDLAFISYGIGPEWFSFGFTVKGILSQRLTIPGIPDKSSNIGSDYDAGILWKPINFLSVGAMLRNGSGTSYKLGTSEEAFPRSGRTGLVLDILGKNSMLSSESFGLKAAYDLEVGNVGDNEKHNSFCGMEGSFNNWLFLRFGGSSIFKIDDNVSGSSVGLGIKFGAAQVDVVNLNDPITETQISYISLSYSPHIFRLFKQPETEKPAAHPQEELINVFFPNEDYVTYGVSVTISGETIPKANVLINGVQAFVGDDGKFSAIQPLTPGKNLIEISANIKYETNTVPRYETKTILRKVLRKAKVIIEEEAGIEKRIAQEVFSKEAEIAKREEEIKKDKTNGIDVSKKEITLVEEKTKFIDNKRKLLEEKNMIAERKEKVENLVTLGVIEVSPTTKFQIEAPITRGEMITWLIKASGLPIPKIEGPVFIDVPQNHKYAPFIKSAFDAGLIKAGPDGKFRPDDPANEGEGQEFFRAFGIVK